MTNRVLLNAGLITQGTIRTYLSTLSILKGLSATHVTAAQSSGGRHHMPTCMHPPAWAGPGRGRSTGQAAYLMLLLPLTTGFPARTPRCYCYVPRASDPWESTFQYAPNPLAVGGACCTCSHRGFLGAIDAHVAELGVSETRRLVRRGAFNTNLFLRRW